MAAPTPIWCMNLSAPSSKAANPRSEPVRSANITCAGICAHESAMKDGERIILPAFTKRI